MKLKVFKQSWLWFLLLIFFQLAIIFFFRFLIVKEVNLLIRETQKLKSLEKRTSSLINVIKDWQTINAKKLLIEQALPDKEGLIHLLENLEKEASSSGLSLAIDVNSSSIKSEAGAKTIEFSLKFQSSYYQMLKLLSQIEDLPQVVKVNSIICQSPAGLEKENNYIFNLKLYLDSKFQ